MSDRLQDRRRLHIFIHSALDELPLSLEAFRIYCHLARRAGDKNEAWPSYANMAITCFKASYPNSPVDSLKRRAMDAVKELEAFGLIAVERDQHRTNGALTSNLYILTDESEWDSKAEIASRNIRNNKKHRPTVTSDTTPTVTSDTTPTVTSDTTPTVTGDTTPTVTSDTSIEGNPYRSLSSSKEFPPCIPPTGGNQDEEGGEIASLKDEYEPGVSDTPFATSEAQEEASEQEQEYLGVDQISAPPGAPQSKAKSSTSSNLAEAAEIVEKLRYNSQQRNVAESDSGTTPKPILKTDPTYRDSEAEWECPIPEKFDEFLQYEADRLVRDKVCPRVEARGAALGGLNRHKRQANIKFEDWLAEQQRQQEQPVERKKLEAMPHFKLESERQIAERIAEYHRLGEEEFLKQKSWHQRWLDEHARKYNLI